MNKSTNWDYVIAEDEFQVFFPEGDYNIDSILEWYKIIPTTPRIFSYYGGNIDLLKRHFELFSNFSDVRTKVTNDFHSNTILSIWCMTIYDKQGILVGFAAQEYLDGFAASKKILYLNDLDNVEYCFNLDE